MSPKYMTFLTTSHHQTIIVTNTIIKPNLKTQPGL